MHANAADISRSWLRNRHAFVTRDWVAACCSWIWEESQGIALSQDEINSAVYEQWLLTDLHEIESSCLPSEAFTKKQTCVFNGTYCVQVDCVRDISQPCFAQLTKITGAENENTSIVAFDKNENRWWEPKPTRMLMLMLTDGTLSDIQAIEYQPIPALSIDLRPGTKAILKGPLTCRSGILLLAQSNIQVLGGEAESLIEINSQAHVLQRALHQPLQPTCATVGGSAKIKAECRHPPQPSPASQATCTSSRADDAAAQVVPRQRLTATTADGARGSSSATVNVKASKRNLPEWESDFEKFDVDEDLLRHVESLESAAVAVSSHAVLNPSNFKAYPSRAAGCHLSAASTTPVQSRKKPCFGMSAAETSNSNLQRNNKPSDSSIPGFAQQQELESLDLDDWDEDQILAEHPHTSDLKNICDARATGAAKEISIEGEKGFGRHCGNGVSSSNSSGRGQYNRLSTVRVVDSISKGNSLYMQDSPDHSLHDKKARLMSPVSGPSCNDVIVVSGSEEEDFLECLEPSASQTQAAAAELPFTYLSKVKQALVYLTEPRVFVIKAYIRTLIGRLQLDKHSGWSLGACINDGSDGLDVLLSDEVLTSLIGYSAQDFITLNKTRKGVANEAIARCQRALANLSCIMEIEFNGCSRDAATPAVLPTVCKLREVTTADVTQLKERVCLT